MTAFITLKHYLKRAFMKPVEVALMTLLPVGIIFLNVSVNQNFMASEEGMQFLWQGYNLINTGVVTNIMVMFMFMSGAYAGEYYFYDLRSVNRWRLNATPVATANFIFGAISGGFIFSSLTGGLILAMGYFFFDMYLGNLIVVLLVLFLVVLMSQFIGIIVAVFANGKGSIDGIMIALSFAMASMVGAFLIPIPMPDFVRDYILPYGVALRAIFVSRPTAMALDYSLSDAIPYLAILAGMTVAFGVAALVIARRRPA